MPWVASLQGNFDKITSALSFGPTRASNNKRHNQNNHGIKLGNYNSDGGHDNGCCGEVNKLNSSTFDISLLNYGLIILYAIFAPTIIML